MNSFPSLLFAMAASWEHRFQGPRRSDLHGGCPAGLLPTRLPHPASWLLSNCCHHCHRSPRLQLLHWRPGGGRAVSRDVLGGGGEYVPGKVRGTYEVGREYLGHFASVATGSFLMIDS